MTASGTAGYGTELASSFDLAELGAVVVKSLAAFEWAGNPAPRLRPTPPECSIRSACRARGFRYWLTEVLPDLLRTGATVVASIWGRSVEEYRAAAELIGRCPRRCRRRRGQPVVPEPARLDDLRPRRRTDG